jgi:hypothetical protein
MKRAALIVAVALVPASARAEAPAPPYAWPAFVDTFVGFGSAPNPFDFVSALTAEVGHRPFGGALSTGVSFSSATDVTGLWNVVTPGAFAKIDLTYVFLSGFWSVQPPRNTHVRVHLGGRVGMGVSQSFQRVVPTATDPYLVDTSYVLVRPELESFVDLDVPLGARRAYSLIFRAAIDTPVTLDDLFRWTLCVGLGYAWGSHD